MTENNLNMITAISRQAILHKSRESEKQTWEDGSGRANRLRITMSEAQTLAREKENNGDNDEGGEKLTHTCDWGQRSVPPTPTVLKTRCCRLSPAEPGIMIGEPRSNSSRGNIVKGKPAQHRQGFVSG